MAAGRAAALAAPNRRQKPSCLAGAAGGATCLRGCCQRGPRPSISMHPLASIIAATNGTTAVVRDDGDAPHNSKAGAVARARGSGSKSVVLTHCQAEESTAKDDATDAVDGDDQQPPGKLELPLRPAQELLSPMTGRCHPLNF